MVDPDLSIGGIPESAQASVSRLMPRATDDLVGVAEAVDAHLDHLRALSREVPTLDLVLAAQVANGIRRLAAWGVERGTSKHRRAIWVVAEYFMCGHDAQPDVGVPEGFVDDAHVFNAVAFYVGRGDLRLAV